MDLLRLEIEGPVASLVIDRPDKRNAFTRAMWDAMPLLVDEACRTPGVRVIVARSSSAGVFSAGADIGEYGSHVGDVAWGMDNQERVSRGTKSLRQARLPVIAAVDGGAFGAGAGLVASCDLRVASTRASFAITPAKLGIVYPFPDTAALVELVGPATARRLLITGMTFDASEAQRIGFVDEVVEPDGLYEALDRWVERLIANSPTSIALMKQQIVLAAGGQQEDDEVTRVFVRQALVSPDYAEGAQAFLERRPARFD